MSAQIAASTRDGHPVRVLRSPDGALEAAFAPSVGMVGCSLTHRGEELLGQRGGLSGYAERGSTMGIPLLHPWANRLSSLTYSAAGRTVEIDPERAPLRRDPNGLPIHGLVSASPHWEVQEAVATRDVAGLVAQLDFAARPELLAGFPFPHRLVQEVALRDGELTIDTTLHAGEEGPVPVSFGYHPYLQLPGVAREEWEVALPVGGHELLDERGIPTGRSGPVEWKGGRLGERTFDDLFSQLDDSPEFELAGGGRRVRVRFDAGYPFAQVYAPGDQDVVCFEPMTAATDALVSGQGLQVVPPGGRYAAGFAITVDSGR